MLKDERNFNLSNSILNAVTFSSNLSLQSLWVLWTVKSAFLPFLLIFPSPWMVVTLINLGIASLDWGTEDRNSNQLQVEDHFTSVWPFSNISSAFLNWRMSEVLLWPLLFMHIFKNLITPNATLTGLAVFPAMYNTITMWNCSESMVYSY